MRLSKRCEYGIKASVRLAQRHGLGYTQSREVAESEELPAKFLEAILLSLRAGGVLESKVGAGGGYRLARSPDQIRVTELIAILHGDEDVPATSGAPSARPGQSAIDALNERIASSLSEALGSLSLAELVALAEERSAKADSAMYYI